MQASHKTAPNLPAFRRAKPTTRQAKNDITMRFGRRIKSLRENSEMTQQQVATKFGIDRSFVSDVERGRKSIRLPMVEVFAIGFGMTLCELFEEI